MEMKRILKEYNEQIYGHKSDNLDETDYFLKRHNLPKFTQEIEIDDLNRFTYIKEI